MTPTTELPPFEARLLSELTEVVEERRRTPIGSRSTPSRRPILAVSAGVAATAVALALAPGLMIDGGSSAFAVRELPGGLIEVDWMVDFRDGEALAAELREFGVDVELVAVPASPSAVGSVHAMDAPDPSDAPGLTFGDELAGEGATFTIDPDVFEGGLTLYLNVEAEPGEPYLLREEVFEPGEVLGGLHCALGEPLRSAEVAPHLDEVEVTPRWEAVQPSPDGDPSVMYTEPRDERPDGQVLWGYALDDRTVELTVLPDGVALPADFAPRLSDVPCSRDQAAAWQ